jgi:predicted metalloprotease
VADWGRISSEGNVEDRRGFSPAVLGGGGLGILGIVLVIGFNLLTGSNINPNDVSGVLNQLQQSQSSSQTGSQPAEFQGQDTYEKFTATVLGSTNDVWKEIFSQSGKTYREPKLVLFRNATQSGCGGATSSVGPHYCPADETIYLDETFFDEVLKRLGGNTGDVAQAYVIAHEAGHHVQKQLGITEKVEARGNSNQDSVKVELQADCFAGVWAHSLQSEGVFQPGEIKEAQDTIAAIGDDRIQAKVQGQINPETWTHGSSAQRESWFNKGFASGKPTDCDTFNSNV